MYGYCILSLNIVRHYMSAGTQKSKRDIPTSIVEADIGEPPDVAEPHGQAEARKEELTVIVPALSLRHLVVHNIHPCFLAQSPLACVPLSTMSMFLRRLEVGIAV